MKRLRFWAELQRFKVGQNSMHLLLLQPCLSTNQGVVETVQLSIEYREAKAKETTLNNCKTWWRQRDEQSEFDANTNNRRQAQENVCQQVSHVTSSNSKNKKHETLWSFIFISRKMNWRLLFSQILSLIGSFTMKIEHFEFSTLHWPDINMTSVTKLYHI